MLGPGEHQDQVGQVRDRNPADRVVGTLGRALTGNNDQSAERHHIEQLVNGFGGALRLVTRLALEFAEGDRGAAAEGMARGDERDRALVPFSRRSIPPG